MSSGAHLKEEVLRNAVNDNDSLSFEFVRKVILPHYVWVMEISTLSDYQDKKCSAVMVLDSTANIDENSAILYWRVGNSVMLGKGGDEQIFRPGSDDPVLFGQFSQNLKGGGR